MTCLLPPTRIMQVEAKARQAACPVAAPTTVPLSWQAEYVQCDTVLRHMEAIASSQHVPALSLVHPAAGVRVSPALRRVMLDRRRALEAQHSVEAARLVPGTKEYRDAVTDLAQFEISCACAETQVCASVQRSLTPCRTRTGMLTLIGVLAGCAHNRCRMPMCHPAVASHATAWARPFA